MTPIVGKNALTVFIGESEVENLNMFFCPYTRNNVVQYTGEVEIIYPSFDANFEPKIIIRPQKLSKNIHYVFATTTDKPSNLSSFYIQNREYTGDPIQVYYCYNCQAPQLYFSGNKTVLFNNKKEIKNGDEYICPNCKKKMKYLGTVSISNPDLIV